MAVKPAEDAVRRGQARILQCGVRMQRPRRVLFAAGMCLLVTTASTAGRQEPAEKSLLEMMLTVMTPASDIIFGAAADPPATPEKWAAVERAAKTLAETARAITRPPHARPERRWTELAETLVRASENAGAAASKHDADALLEAGDAVYEPCKACHDEFIGGAR
jgi:hypothetical protein